MSFEFVNLDMSSYIVNPTVEQENLIKAFLEEQHISFFKQDETLPVHVLEGIRRGQEDIAAGRFITFEEFKEKYPVDLDLEDGQY